jgi:hypothetical protein
MSKSSSGCSIPDIMKSLTNERRQRSLNILEVPDDILRMIKAAMKANPDCADEMFRCILVDLENKGGPSRIKLFKLCDYVLCRSERFRNILFSDIKEIVKRSGINRKLGGIPPKTHHKELETLFFRFIACWDADYGTSFPSLRAIVRYMRESLCLHIPDIMEERRARQEESDSQLAESIALTRVRVRQAFAEMDGDWDDITGNLDRLEESFRLMFPDVTDGNVLFDMFSNKTPPPAHDGKFLTMLHARVLLVNVAQRPVSVGVACADNCDRDWEDGYVMPPPPPAAGPGPGPGRRAYDSMMEVEAEAEVGGGGVKRVKRDHEHGPPGSGRGSCDEEEVTVAVTSTFASSSVLGTVRDANLGGMNYSLVRQTRHT